MAHFAKINNTTKEVIEVVVVSNNNCLNENGIETEQAGVNFLTQVFGEDSNIIWKQTSYNGNFRKNFALSGYIYDSQKDAFYSLEAPAPDMEFDSETCKWKMKSIGIEKL